MRAYKESLELKGAQKSGELGANDGLVESDRAVPTQEEDVEQLEGLLTAEQITNIKSAIGSLELENAISELLDRNARALQRLEALQFERLMETEEGPKDVQAGSEEWDTGDDLSLIPFVRV